MGTKRERWWMMKGNEERDAVLQRKESRRASGPKAVAARWSRDGKQNCTLEDWRRSILGGQRSRREDSRRAISYIA